MEKKTPLYDVHVEAGGRIVPFGGYLLPVQYPKGILHEHRLVREKAGMFDVSHMGEFIMEGKDSLANINHLLTNSYDSLQIGRARYGIMCYENGTAVDDLLVYKLADEKYLLVVNASNCDKDYEWMKQHLFGEVRFENIADSVGQIAVQGPDAVRIIAKLTDRIPEKNYSFIDGVQIGDIKVLLSRTGYTGEDGFELYCRSEDTVYLWKLLLETGSEYGLEPCALGCRDTLRLEAAMPLYGHELSDEITPLESSLGFFVKLNKEFIGCEALKNEVKRTRIGLVVTDKGIVREHCEVYCHGEKAGMTTSGTFSPTLNKAVAMAIIDRKFEEETEFDVIVRGRSLKCAKVALPFYKRSK